MNLSAEHIEGLATETGFRPETLEKVIRLGEFAADVGRHPLLSRVLALKGGTALNLMFGSDTQSVDLGFDTLYFADGFIDVPIAKLIGVVMAAMLAAGVIIFMKSSRMGQAIRATSQDARAARVLGIEGHEALRAR